MHKLSDYEAGGDKVPVATYYSTDKRQVVRDGPVNIDGYADFITPVGDGNTQHLLNFETSVSDALTGNKLRIKDDMYNPYTSVYWSLYNGAQLDTSWKKFGTTSVKLTKASSYCRTIGKVPQYNTSARGWTEEFTFKTGTKFKNIQIFRGYNSNGYGLALRTNGVGRLQIYVDSRFGGAWDISNGELSSVTIAPDTEYRIAIEYDNSQYRLYVNGQTVWSKTSGRKIINISARILGWSSGSSEGWYDEYRFSNTALYRGNYTPSSVAFSAPKSRKVYVTPEDGRPIRLSMSESIREHSLQIADRLISADLETDNTNYLYIDFNKLNNQYSLASTVIEPQYGSSFDYSRHSLLTFDRVGEEISDGSTGFVYDSSSPDHDEYGNVWIANDILHKRTLGEDRKHVVFNGTTSYMQGEIYALPKRWSIRVAHSVDVNSGTRTLFSYGGNVNGYGIRINTRFVTGGMFEYIVYLSSNGTSWNVASATVVAGGSAAIPQVMTLSYDGDNITLVTANGVVRTWAAPAGVRPTYGGKFELGRSFNSSYYLGKVYEFSLEPFVRKQSPLFDRNGQPPLIRGDIHFFNIYTMEMKKTDSMNPSIEPESPPAMGDALVRLFIGEVVVDSEGVVDTATYALNGLYVSNWYPVRGLNTYRRRHNLGSDLYTIQSYINTQPRSQGSYYTYGPESARVGDSNYHVGPTIGELSAVAYTVRPGTYVGRWTPFIEDGEGVALITEGYYKQIITRSF